MAATSTSSVKTCKDLDFATNLKAIPHIEAAEKSSTVADDFAIPRSILSTLLKNKADIKSKAAKQRTLRACRVHAPAHEKIEKESMVFRGPGMNILVDGPMVMAKAKWFAPALDEDNFDSQQQKVAAQV
ncbi:hypothetical protein HPB49_003528 [Dermacentor silvarum]|uniref:Uncharacterized protein n=1 Tax=Dermacentor silvarum TaxID=543639 RepID=A0ACB8DTV9_DERSI|nr:hypothetical protein HPB49_003528 [Dermacentor silvarum]